MVGTFYLQVCQPAWLHLMYSPLEVNGKALQWTILLECKTGATVHSGPSRYACMQWSVKSQHIEAYALDRPPATCGAICIAGGDTARYHAMLHHNLSCCNGGSRKVQD